MALQCYDFAMPASCFAAARTASGSCRSCLAEMVPGMRVVHLVGGCHKPPIQAFNSPGRLHVVDKLSLSLRGENQTDVRTPRMCTTRASASAEPQFNLLICQALSHTITPLPALLGLAPA